MKRESSVQLGVRVPETIKSALEQHAGHRHLDVADIAREAFREYIEKHPVEQALLPNLNGKKDKHEVPA